MATNRPKVIDYSWEAIVKKEDKDRNKPDAAYEFSNGRKFDSTDRAESGIYRRS